MNTFLQIAIGLCPALILFLVLTLVNLKKKGAGQVVNISMLSTFGVAAVVTLILGLTITPKAEQMTKSSTEVALQLAYAAAEAGDYNLASDLLDSVRADTADSAAVAECSGLIYAAKGDARSAKAMFAKANMMEKLEDYNTYVSLCDATINEQITVALGNATPKASELKKFANKKMKEAVTSNSVRDMSDVLIESQKLYDAFLTEDRLDEKKAKALLEKAEKAFRSTPELEQVEQARLCRVKLQALIGDYAAIAEQMSDDSSFDELAIAAELYINKRIDEKDFSSAYGEEYAKMAEPVAKQLKKIRPKFPSDDRQQLAAVDSLIQQLDTAGKHPATNRMKAELTMYANDTSSIHRPKAYMQLARLDYAEGNDESAAQNISSSLNTIGVCEDENFAAPMIDIVDAITDKDDAEKMKSVAANAEEATRNASDALVVKTLEVYEPEEEDNATEEDQNDNLDNNNSNNNNYYDDFYGDSDSDDEDDKKPGISPSVPDENKQPTNSENEQSEPEENRSPFELFFADTASHKRNAFKITSVDAADFETVRLMVNVDPSISVSADELKELIRVKDCGIEITDFTVEKVEFSGSNILLCCDTSGSMDGQPIRDLREAVQKFAETSDDIESIALVTFNSGVSKVYEFGTEKSEIISAAQSLYSSGGTNMYGAIQHAITMFTPADNELNYILLMSDGADGVSPTPADIQANIGDACMRNGIVLYSLGLGSSVNADYMQSLANVTGGGYEYVTDSVTLDTFYDSLRNQTRNCYVITYTAKDTLKMSRNASVSLKDNINDHIVSDTKFYSLPGADDDLDGGSESVLIQKGVAVSGLDTRRVFKSELAITVRLVGTGFTDKDSISAKLDGPMNYDLACEYVNDTTFKVTLPGGMTCGVYDLVVTMNDKTAYFTKELTVSVQEDAVLTEFGNYKFTSDSSETKDGRTILSGYVTLNGWLHFNGDVELIGSLNNTVIQVIDQDGSYIQYYADSATGLAQLLAKRNMTIPIPALGTFNLHKDISADGEDDDHRVDTIFVDALYISNTIELSAPGIQLYPHQIVFKSNAFSTKFPFQDKLMKAASIEDLFEFDLSIDVTFTNKQIGTKIETSNDPDDKVFSNNLPANFGLMDVYTTDLKYDICIDTLNNKYSVELGIRVAFLPVDGLSLALEWGQREEYNAAQFLIPKKIEIGADFDINTTIGPVPVTFCDFAVGVEDIDFSSIKSIGNIKLTGRFDLKSATASSFFPALKKIGIEDVALLKFNDNKITTSLCNNYFSIETEAQLLEEITLGKLSIEAGKISYSSVLLDMDDVTAYGLRASLTQGVIWKNEFLNINLSNTGTVNLHSQFFGVEAEGNCVLGVKWWELEKDFYANGHALLGFVRNRQDGYTFMAKARGEVKGLGAGEAFFSIDKDGKDWGAKRL